MNNQTDTWAKYWTATELQDSTRAAFEQLRFQAMTQPPLKIDHAEFIKQARTYKKVSKGSDSFLAKELTQIPEIASSEIVSALNAAHAEYVAPHQLLCNLNPVLGKPSEQGHPQVYALFVRHPCCTELQQDAIRQ